MDNPVALVTGASGGIGRSIALRLGREGLDVAFHYRTGRREAEEGAREARETGVRAVAVAGDISIPEDVASIFHAVEDSLGPPTVLINNAGIAPVAPNFDDVTEELWDGILAVNLKGQFLCTREAVPGMRKSGGGIIVNIGSEMAFHPKNQSLPYHIAASGRVMMTQWLALQLAPDIRVNCVSPGVTATGIGGGRYLDPEFQASIASQVPMGRIGRPEDIAELAAFLTSERAGFITGQTFLVNGGRICH